jgi:hypothetical protein
MVSLVVHSVFVSVSVQFRLERVVYLYHSCQFSFVLSKIQGETRTKKCLFRLPWL